MHTKQDAYIKSETIRLNYYIPSTLYLTELYSDNIFYGELEIIPILFPFCPAEYQEQQVFQYTGLQEASLNLLLQI